MYRLNCPGAAAIAETMRGVVHVKLFPMLNIYNSQFNSSIYAFQLYPVQISFLPVSHDEGLPPPTLPAPSLYLLHPMPPVILALYFSSAAQWPLAQRDKGETREMHYVWSLPRASWAFG